MGKGRKKGPGGSSGGPGRMGADLSKDFGCCDCGFQQRSSLLESDVTGVSSMKLHENNQRFLRAMAEGGKSDLILGLFSTTREFDVNAVDDLRETALHKAARNGHVIVCHVLMKRGANAGLQNAAGKTAANLAAENNHTECANYLQNPGTTGSAKSSVPGDAPGLPRHALTALYDYTASEDIPFLPDPRRELSMHRGDVFSLMHKRPEDGWCLVSTTSGSEGWVPGNFVTADGRTPLVIANDL